MRADASMTLLKTPFAPVRSKRLRHLSDHLRRDIGLPDRQRPVGLDLTTLFFTRQIE
jgi:hypothetical protein